MSDRILIRDLLVYAILGVKPDERQRRQAVLINLALEVDTRPAAASDAIAEAVDYAALTQDVITLAEGTRYYLVEKLASEIAWLCLDDGRTRQATVTVEKPTALRPARSVGVEVTRTQEERQSHPFVVYIALGANLEAERNLRLALERLDAHCPVEAVSSAYESAPIDGPDQPCYLCAVARATTALPPRELQGRVLRAIGTELGRGRSADRFAPRPIDLDLIFYGDRVQASGEVRVPAEEITRCAHVAVPLAELAPELRHPERDETIAFIASGIDCRRLKRRSDIALWPR